MRTPSSLRPESTGRGFLLRGVISISREELAASADISVQKLERLVELGVVEPIAPGANEFPAASAVRLRKTLRLRADLGVHLLDAAIIMDLLERLEALEAELIRLRSSSGE